MLFAWRDLFRSNPLNDFARTNTLSGIPRRVQGKFSIKYTQGGNTLIIEENVEFHHVHLQFGRTGSTIIFRAGCRPYGHFIASDGGTIVVGKSTRFNKACRLQAIEGKTISVGQKCLFADVSIRTSDVHSVISLETGERLNMAKDVTIGNRVWIAEKASIYKGVTIGDGSIVGAHSVVVKSAPKNCAVAGNPARVIRETVTWRMPLLGPEGDPSAAKRRT